jgi:hypothetical protein
MAGDWSASLAQSSDALRLQAFAQGKANNCVSVALIKAAIQRYGVGQVFDTVRTGSQVRVKLRDRTELTVSDAERRQAASQATFKQPAVAGLPTAERAALVGYANFCYAVMAKYLETQKVYLCTDDDNQLDSTAALGSYQHALDKLTEDGLCSDNAYRHLGLRALDQTAPPYKPSEDFSSKKGVVAYNSHHAVFIMGKQYDHYGTWWPLAKRTRDTRKKFKPKWVFQLK